MLLSTLFGNLWIMSKLLVLVQPQSRQHIPVLVSVYVYKLLFYYMNLEGNFFRLSSTFLCSENLVLLILILFQIHQFESAN